MTSSVIGALRVVLGLDSAQYEAGLKKGGVSASNFQRKLRGMQRASVATEGALRGMAAAFGVASAGAAARGFISLADQSAKLTAQLKLATAQTGSFAQAQADVRQIAADTRSGLAETATLYAVFARTAGELGMTQAEVARITTTVNQAFKVSGASTEEASGATRQLIQAFQSGVLRGEEFNSMMENAPRLAQLLAASLGVPVGELRKMAEAGQLTAAQLKTAFSDTRFTDQLDAEFREMPVTFDEAMTQIHNSAVITFGAFDRGGEFSKALASFMTDGADGFADLEASAERFGITVSSAFAGIMAVGDETIAVIRGINDALGGIPFESISWLNEKSRYLNPTTLLADSVVNSPTFQNARAKRQGELGMKRILRGDPFADFPGMRPRAAASPARGGARSGGGGGSGSGGGGRRGPSADQLRAQADREAARAADALRRFADMLGAEQADLKENMARLSGSASALANAQVAKVEADRAREERRIAADDQLDDAQRDQLLTLAEQNANARIAMIRQEEMDRQRQDADRIAMDALDLETELLRLSADMARTARERRGVELRILDIAFEQERIRLEGIKATAAVTSAEWAYANARLGQIGALKSGAQAQAIAQTQGPLDSYLDKLPRSAEEAREAIERIQVDGLDSLVDGLAQAVTGARSLGSVFKQVANQIIADLIRIQMQKMVAGLFSSVLGGVGGGGLAPLSAGGIDKALAATDSLVASRLPGFATGGSFRVGGSSAVGDQNIVAFRANAGEMVDIRKPGSDRGGGPAITFDMRGALTLPELLGQIERIAANRADVAVLSNNARQQRGAQRRLGR